MSDSLELEASCRLISPIFSELEANGIDPEELLEGLAVPVSHLRDTSRWTDWATLHEVARRAEARLPRDHAYQLGLRSFDTPAYRYVGAAIRTLFSVERAYFWSLGPTGILHRYYTCFESEVRELGPGRLEVVLRMKPGYPVSRFFQSAVQGQLAATPTIFGMPRARVEASDLDDGTRFEVTLPGHSEPRSRWRRVLSLPRALFSAADELKQAHSTMELKLKELEEEVQHRERVEAELRAEIGERQRAEAEQATLERELHQARRLESIGLLAGGVAHDFNNLLVVILGHAHIAASLTNEEKVEASLGEIAEAGRRAAEITRQLLAFGRRQVIQPKALDVGDVVHGMSALLGRLLPESVEFDLHAPLGLGPVEADASQLEQVLMNLTVNARDAMPNGGKLTIDLEETEIDEEYAQVHAWSRPGRYVLLRVTDSGSGIAPELVEQIFDPFFTTKPEGSGTGLGLSVVFGIVSQHRGFLHVYSEPGVGTSMKVFLPITSGATSPRAPTLAAEARGGDESILLVEDDAQVQSLARQVLEGAGYEVVTASTGDAAIAILRDRPADFDLLVLDVVLPGRSGRSVHDVAHELHPNSKVLFTSGYSPRGIHSEFILDEGLDFMAKPYSPTGLLRRVREALDDR